jgi:DNA repair exonuclease SbcCD ATPase subunit
VDQYILEEEESIMTEEIDSPLGESEVGPTSIDVTDEPVSIGPTSIDVTDEQASILETPPAEQQEEKVQEQNKQIEQAQEEFKISNRKQKRRITSYLSNISKQVEKQGNQINKMTLMIQSLQKQKQKQTKSTVNSGIGHSQSQSIKQIQSQISQLQKRVTRIQKDIQRIRTIPTKRTNTRLRKPSSTTCIIPRSKKGKSLKNIRARKGVKKDR